MSSQTNAASITLVWLILYAPVSVSDVHRLLIRREAKTVRPAKTIGDDSHVSRSRVEAVDLTRQLRFASEALLVAV